MSKMTDYKLGRSLSELRMNPSLWLYATSLHAGSGLSSSSALVCSTTIAIMAAFDVNFPKVYFNHFSNYVIVFALAGVSS